MLSTKCVYKLNTAYSFSNFLSLPKTLNYKVCIYMSVCMCVLEMPNKHTHTHTHTHTHIYIYIYIYIGSAFSCRHVLSKITDKDLVFGFFFHFFVHQKWCCNCGWRQFKNLQNLCKCSVNMGTFNRLQSFSRIWVLKCLQEIFKWADA